MTLDEFNSALVIAYERACRYYGDEYAGSAIESTLAKGADAFETVEKVINYTLRSAKGDKESFQRDEGTRARNEQAAGRDITLRPPPVRADDSTFALDLAINTKELEPDMRAAVEAYLLHGMSIKSAARYIQADVGITTKCYWLRVLVDKLTADDLKDYQAP